MFFFVTRIRIAFQVSILITLPPNFFDLIFMLASECVYKIESSSPTFFHMTVHIGPNWLILGPYLAQIGPKLAQNWLKIGSKLAQKWLKIGSKLVRKKFKIGSKKFKNRVVLPSIKGCPPPRDGFDRHTYKLNVYCTLYGNKISI